MRIKLKSKKFEENIIEKLEAIPPEGTCILIAGHPIEVVQVKENTIKIARIAPKLPN